ncbi:MAG: phospholipase D-like domain-containing protein [Capnocytophaga sp.]|nr:phospholipase D-like domain-containing protein [Capnocytophaga sp.]
MNFLTGNKLEEAIYDTLFKTEKELIIISPYIKLGTYLMDNVFNQHLNNSKLHIIIGYGKNELDKEKSFKREEIEYFLQFPNVTIIYIPELHGKYYANERQSIITSMNLIDYSLVNNVEFGVFSKKNIIDVVNKSNFFKSSKREIMEIMDSGYTIFVKRPNYDKKMFGLVKNYVGSSIQLNLVENCLMNKKIEKIRYSSFSAENYVNIDKTKQRIKRENKLEPIELKKGYCIRCNTRIAYDTNTALCSACFSVWADFGNPHYLEKYCHSCGNKKNDISVAKPLCYDCYKKSKR